MNDKTFIRVFQNDVTDKFFKELSDVVDPTILHTMNSVISVYGGTGTGKSIIVMSILKKVIPERFSYKNMCFFDSQILNMAKKLPKDSFIVRDEGVDKAIYGVGSQRTSRQLQVLTETCRKAGLSIVFIEPEFRDNELSKYYLETFDMDVDNRLTRVAVRDNVTKQCIGAIYVPVLPEDDEDWVRYNEIKDQFIEDMKAGKLKESKEDYKSMAQELVKKIDLDLFSKKKERLAFIRTELPTLTNAEVDMVATFVEILIKHGISALTENDEEEEKEEE